MDNLNKLTNDDLTHIDDLEFYKWSTIVIISRRGSGKTTLIKNLMFNLCNKHDYNCVIVFSETAEYEMDEWAYADKFYKTDEIEEKVTKIMDYQKTELKKKGKDK